MEEKEYVQITFDEAKEDMIKYYSNLPNADANHFDEFQLVYDNQTYSLQLLVKDESLMYSELNIWNEFNLTMFKELISIADKFTKSKDKIELWDVISIKLVIML